MMNEGQIAEVEPAPATYMAPAKRIRPTNNRTKPPQILVNVKPAALEPRRDEDRRASHFSCVIMIIFLVILLMIGLLFLCLFLGVTIDDEPHKEEQGEKLVVACASPHLIGNGRCDQAIRHDPSCQNDEEDDCYPNEKKEEIARVICQAIREVLGGVNCQQSVYQTHPYCEPCGKLDYSWNYLTDELHQFAAHWLDLVQKATTTTSSTRTTSTTTE